MQYVDISATVWPLKSTSGFRKTENSIDKHRLMSYVTLMVERRVEEIARNGDKRRPTSAYAQTGSRNIAETA